MLLHKRQKQHNRKLIGNPHCRLICSYATATSSIAQLHANNPYVQLAQHSVAPATTPQQTQFVRPPPAPDLSNVGVKSAHKPVHRSQQRSVARPVVRQQPRGELITNNGVTFRRLPDGSLELVSGPITATAAQWGVR